MLINRYIKDIYEKKVENESRERERERERETRFAWKLIFLALRQKLLFPLTGVGQFDHQTNPLPPLPPHPLVFPKMYLLEGGLQSYE